MRPPVLVVSNGRTTSAGGPDSIGDSSWPPNSIGGDVPCGRQPMRSGGSLRSVAGDGSLGLAMSRSIMTAASVRSRRPIWRLRALTTSRHWPASASRDAGATWEASRCRRALARLSRWTRMARRAGSCAMALNRSSTLMPVQEREARQGPGVGRGPISAAGAAYDQECPSRDAATSAFRLDGMMLALNMGWLRDNAR